jgi:hypothetical protein
MLNSMYLISSKEADLEANLTWALDLVPIESMKWYGSLTCKLETIRYSFHYYLDFSTRSHQFMDGYQIGLNGRQAAYACTNDALVC